MPFKKFPNQFVPLPYDRHFQLNTIKSWTPALSTTKPSSKAYYFSKWIHLLWICKSETISRILNYPLHNFPYQNHYQDKSVIPLLYFPPLHSFPSSHSWFHPLLSRPTLLPSLSLCILSTLRHTSGNTPRVIISMQTWSFHFPYLHWRLSVAFHCSWVKHICLFPSHTAFCLALSIFP